MLPMTMDTESFVRMARAHASQWVSMQTRQSYPILHHLDQEISIAFLYSCQFANPQKGLELMPPHLLLSFDLNTQNLSSRVELSRDVPSSADPHGFIGAITLPPGITVDDFKHKQLALYRAYDELLMNLARGNSKSESMRSSVVHLSHLLKELVESPLIPYYRKYGHEFFDWLVSLGGEPLPESA